ncbi:PEGA domain-containing protein [Ramlibacter sp.]|uniref:PEGA domain-containing protein n=1 Tax=Ramlibacter sp. TaxID=1917967 RepID=UPI003D11D47D
MSTSPPNEPRARDDELIAPAAFRPPGALHGFEWPAVPWGAIAIVVTVAVTALVMGYLLLARSILIETDPVDAELAVDEWLAPRIGRHWLLTPGEHAVRASAPGYKRLVSSIDVTTDTLQQHRLALTPLPGRLAITLTPASQASVRIDGQPVGEAPGTIEEVEAGTRLVELSAPRYLPYTATIEVRGKRLEETLDATLEPAWADFALQSAPAGAALAIDGEEVGTTPYAGELLHGKRRLDVRMKGYKPWTRTIDVLAGQPVTIPDVTLAKADGIFELVTQPAGAAITIDGRFRGEAPTRLAVTPDRAHRVTVMKAGYAPLTIEARAAPDQLTALALKLEPELAVINLITEPADAELLVDGEPAGNATQRLNLPTHEHELIVRKAGYATYRTVVTPRKGVDKHLRITLKTAAQMVREQQPSPPPPPRAAPETLPPPGETPPPLSAQPPVSSQATQAAQASVDIANNPFVPDEIRAEAEALLRPTPPASGEQEIRTSSGQTLRRFTGGALELPKRPPATLTRPFYLATREVTNADYRRFISSHVSRGASGQELNADTQPVVGISWEAAATYCNWLSRRESLPPFYQIRYGRVLGVNPAAVGYRLPTEAEWDWATSRDGGGKPLRYPWGERYPPRERVGNLADQAASSYLGTVIKGYDDGFAATAPVGSFAPNPHGLYDVAGNVAEWMHDAFAPAPAGGRDPLGPTSAAQHVVRGSSWSSEGEVRLQSAYREAAQGPRPDLGFRLARYLQ